MSSFRHVAVSTIALVACHSGPKLQGKAAFHAQAVAAYQSLNAGGAYPYTALRVVSPEGTALPANARVGAAITEISRALRHMDADAPTYLASLDLWMASPSFAGDAVEIDFFTDAAATHSAGSVKMDGAGDATATSPTYPVAITVTVNITGGTLPSTGSIALKLSDGTGANTMTGTITIRQVMTLDLALTLSDSGAVAGTITIVQNGATMKCTGVTGDLSGLLTCPLTVEPYGWTGTGKFGVLTGELELTINAGGTASTASATASGIINLTYSDGTSETVADAVNAPLTGGDGTSASSGGGSTGTSSGSSSGSGGSTKIASATYVLTTGAFLSAGLLKDNGTFVGQIPGSSGGSGYVVTSAADTTGGIAFTGGTPYYLTETGEILGNVATDPAFPNVTDTPLVWAATGGAPLSPGLSLHDTLNGNQFSAASVFNVTGAGVFIGRAQFAANHDDEDVYWPSLSADPVPLEVPAQSYPSGEFEVAGVSRNGQIVDVYYGVPDAAYHLYYWSSPTAAPIDLGAPASAAGWSVSNKGEIVGTNTYADNCQGQYYYASPTAVATTVPALSQGDAKCDNQVSQINDNSIMVGTSLLDDFTTTHGAIWQRCNTPATCEIVDVNSLLPAGLAWYVQSCGAINDNNQILCRPNGGPYAAGTAVPYVLISLH